MYKNDLKRGNDNGRTRNAGMRRAPVTPTPFELMQMRAASSRGEQVIPHVKHVPPSFTNGAEQSFEEDLFQESGIEENEACEKEEMEKCTEEASGEDKAVEICKGTQNTQNAPIGRDELLIGALLAFLLFSDGDNDIVLIGILIFLLI